MIRLVLADKAEIQRFTQSNGQHGLARDLDYLRHDPLAQQSRGKIRNLDAMHLSICDDDPSLVQWYGRGSTGYYYPVGPVMRMVDDS